MRRVKKRNDLSMLWSKQRSPLKEEQKTGKVLAYLLSPCVYLIMHNDLHENPFHVRHILYLNINMLFLFLLTFALSLLSFLCSEEFSSPFQIEAFACLDN